MFWKTSRDGIEIGTFPSPTEAREAAEGSAHGPVRFTQTADGVYVSEYGAFTIERITL